MAEPSEITSRADAVSNDAQTPPAPSLVEQIDYVRGLAQVIAQQGLSELEVESDGLKFTLKAPVVTLAPLAGAAVSVAPMVTTPDVTPKAADTLIPVVSPMVGVFYRAPSPADPNFVEVGDRVERGQTIGLIEAMKVFNEITAESGGVVAEIPAQSGALVETGQPLVLLR